MANSLNVFTDNGALSGVMLIVTIILATVILLVVIAYTTAGFMAISRKVFHKTTDISNSVTLPTIERIELNDLGEFFR